MSLLTYEDARPWAKAMKARTAIRDKMGAMPPWYIEKNIGIQHYKNDPSLSDEEIAKIAKWADSGAPRGNNADMPAPKIFPDGTQWNAGTPDLIVESPQIDMRDHPGAAGIVDQDVEPALGRADRGGEPFDRARILRRRAARPVAAARQARNQPIGGIGVAPKGNHDPRPRLGEEPGCRRTQAFAAAGHQRHLSVEHPHSK